MHEKEEAHILRVGIKSVRINVKKPRKGLSSPPQENFWSFMLEVKFHQASRKVYQNIPFRKVFIFCGLVNLRYCGRLTGINS